MSWRESQPPPPSGGGPTRKPGGSSGSGAALAAKMGRQVGFLLDLNRCVGCGACVVACRIENDLPGGVAWRRILTLNETRVPSGPTYHFSLACHHCLNPPCVKGCPSGALEKRPDGIVFLQEELCIGCRYCEMTCPFGAPAFDEERGMMTKCHLCAPRQEKGLQPACTQACPTGALRFSDDVGDLSDSFVAPQEVPGFSDPGGFEPSLRLAPPGGELRAARFEKLKKLARPTHGGSDG